MKDCNSNFYDAVVEEVNSVYSGLSLTSVDANYIGALVHEIISSTFNEKGKSQYMQKHRDNPKKKLLYINYIFHVLMWTGLSRC